MMLYKHTDHIEAPKSIKKHEIGHNCELKNTKTHN